MFRAFLFAIVLATAMAFNGYPRICRPAKMLVMVVFDKPKQKQTQQEYRINQGTANLGVYAPDGFTPEQYEAKLKKESEEKAKKAAKFKIGKEPESLTDWMLKEKAKGHVGRDLLRKGHRMMKARDPKWYTDESPLDF